MSIHKYKRSFSMRWSLQTQLKHVAHISEDSRLKESSRTIFSEGVVYFSVAI